MRPEKFLFVGFFAVIAAVFAGCSSGPSTWEEEEAAYQRNNKVQSYENQREQQEMNYLSDGEVSNPSGYNAQQMDF
ncbi:MAG: hypothetical protein ACQKBV_05365 [Puniceicoccales bacterium]